MARRSRVVSLCLFVAITPWLCAQSGDKRGEVQAPLPDHVRVPPAPVRSPEEEQATFKLAPGFRAELVAADPLVGDPVAMQFGPDGRLWVLEMRGYMPTPEAAGEREPVGVIAVLTDTDRDGRFDKRDVFADGLVMARALSLVGDGLLVAEPPHLWFLRDTNGDGRADEKTEIANDYGNTNNPEHNANGLMWAMDNWIYSANYTARFKWRGAGKFERETTITRGQWGITQDDVGRIYYNSNSDPLRYDAVPAAYLKRNPSFSAAGANVQLVPGSLPIWPSRMTTGVNRGYKTLNEEFKITSMTAASGPVVYRGTVFPAEFRGDAFVPEPSANLIKRIKLTEKDGVIAGANAYQGKEFMTSTDERFRPVNLYNGPDGALYVVDLYRGLIQHRIYLTSYLRKQVEERGLDKGIAKGRIWRIVPDGGPKAVFDPRLKDASNAGLVARLADDNGWVRDTAQRLLVERLLASPDAAATAALEKLIADRTAPALGRVHALWVLSGTKVSVSAVRVALDDPDPRVVAAAVRVAEDFIRPNSDGSLRTDVLGVSEKRTDPIVRLQLALSLGEMKSPEGDAALRKLALAVGAQRFVADAIVSGLAGREVEFVEQLAKVTENGGPAAEAVRFATSAVLKRGYAAQVERVLGLAAAPATAGWARDAVLAGVKLFVPKSSDGKTLAGKLPAEPKALLALAQQKNSPASKTARDLLAHLEWPGKPGVRTAPARPLNAAEQALFEKGKAQFAAVCAACHQPNGQGLEGLAPPLVNSSWVNGDPRILARIVLNGKARENLIMPPWKAALDDESIAGILTFIRRSWGHDADPVAPAIVAEARQATAQRDEPFNDAELQELAREFRPRRRQ